MLAVWWVAEFVRSRLHDTLAGTWFGLLCLLEYPTLSSHLVRVCLSCAAAHSRKADLRKTGAEQAGLTEEEQVGEQCTGISLVIVEPEDKSKWHRV